MLKAMFAVIALIVILAALAVLSHRINRKGASGNINLKARRPLTPFEEKMFFALRDALPNHIILAQVSFSALVTSRREHRNYFDRKYADFVICDQKLTPVLVIELDDSTHKTKTERDAKRDAMLATAGYRTIRYTAVPSATTIQADVAPQPNDQTKAA